MSLLSARHLKAKFAPADGNIDFRESGAFQTVPQGRGVHRRHRTASVHRSKHAIGEAVDTGEDASRAQDARDIGEQLILLSHRRNVMAHRETHRETEACIAVIFPMRRF
jgi:hypothetical protein